MRGRGCCGRGRARVTGGFVWQGRHACMIGRHEWQGACGKNARQ